MGRERRFEICEMVPRNQVSWAVFWSLWLGAALRMKKRENTGGGVGSDIESEVEIEVLEDRGRGLGILVGL